MFRRTIAAAALLLAPVAAATPQDARVRTAEVSTAGIDLTTDQGKATLQRRIDRAVNDVCADRGRLDLRAHVAELSCRSNAQVDARRQLEAAVANARTPTRVALRADVSVRGQ